MTTINNLKSMEFHYFESPSRLYIFTKDLHNVIIADLDFEFDTDFCIDSKAFNMMQKLKTNRKLKIDGNTLHIASKEGKFKTQLIEKEKPKIQIDSFEYENIYDTEVLKRAAKFVSTNNNRIILCGVLFNRFGGVVGTDSYKIYQYNNCNELRYSVPATFINYLNKDKVLLKFTQNKVMYECEYKVISSLYSGTIPNLETIIKGIDAQSICNFTLKNCDELHLYQSSNVILDIKKDVVQAIFKDEINEFKTEISCESDIEIKFMFSYDHLMTAFNLFDDLKINMSQNNLQPIIIKNGLELIIVMPMRV